jgi:hypothetical protein
MPDQPRQRRLRWLLTVPWRRIPLTTGLILPVMLAVGVMAGLGSATPAQPSIHPHPASQPGAAQAITGRHPPALSPAVPVLNAGPSDPLVSQAPFMTASGQASHSYRLSQLRASRHRSSMSQGQCRQQRPGYTPGRVYAKASGDSQPGGPPAATPPGQTIRPPIIHVSYPSPPGRGRMQGIPQTRHQAG